MATTEAPPAQSLTAPTAENNTSARRGGGKRGGNKGERGGKGGRGHAKSVWSRGPPVQSQTQSSGGGQSRMKSKGKEREPVGKESSVSEKYPDESAQGEDQDKAAEAEAAAAATDSEEVCFICAEPVKYHSVSACNHRTCHVCALRLRALYKKTECTFCKEPQHAVVFTASHDKPYEEYELQSMPHKDNKLSIYFEAQEMMEETLILLRFNCPDPDCDYIGNGWGDLRLHTRAAHNRLMCDLCIHQKKVFAHEHALYQPNMLSVHLPSKGPRYRPNVSKDQVEGGVHPICEFCRQCFFGDDELYAHLRERHEDCFVCKRNDVRNQYFQDYNSLELHFHEAHHPCAQPQCLARKFVVFGTILDLKAHMVEEHGGDMTSRDRKDARRVVADFTFEDRHGHGRRDFNQEREREREREREPPPSRSSPTPSILAGPPRQPHTAGQNRRREAFRGKLTVDGAPTIGESNTSTGLPAMETSQASTLIRDDADSSIADPQDAVISRLQSLATNPTTAVPAVKAAIRGYRSSESSARDFISTVWNILDQNLENTARIVNAFVDSLEEEEKKEDLLSSWKVFAIEQRRQFPELVPTAVGGNYASITSGHALNAKHSTLTRASRKSSRKVWDRVAQAASSSVTPQATRSTSSLNQFPALEKVSQTTSSPGPAIRPVPQSQRTTPWTSSGANAGQSMPAETKIQVVAAPPRSSPSSRSSKPQRPPKLSSAQFPELPTSSAAKQKVAVSGNTSLQNILGVSAGPAVAAWHTGPALSVAALGVNNDGIENTGFQGDGTGQGKGKKGKGKQKQTLFTFGRM